MNIFHRFNSFYGKGFGKTEIHLGEEYASVIPKDLHEFMKNSGACNYMEGLLRVVDPNDYREIIQEWNVPNNFRYPIVFACTAFGDLMVWMNNTVFILEVQYGEWVDMGVSNISDFFNMHLCDSQFIEDAFGRNLFLEVRKQLPIPEIDECYTFVPIPALGGSGAADTVKIAKTREYLYLLSQIV